MKINGRHVSNESKLTVFGGVNVIESDDLLLSVAEKFKKLSEKLGLNYAVSYKHMTLPTILEV